MRAPIRLHGYSECPGLLLTTCALEAHFLRCNSFKFQFIAMVIIHFIVKTCLILTTLLVTSADNKWIFFSLFSLENKLLHSMQIVSKKKKKKKNRLWHAMQICKLSPHHHHQSSTDFWTCRYRGNISFWMECQRLFSEKIRKHISKCHLLNFYQTC